MDLIFVTGWLEKLGQWLVAPIVAALATAFLVPWFQERRRVRGEHLEAIKKGVLAPLLDTLGPQLSVLRQKAAPIVVEAEALPDEDPRPPVTGGPPQRYRYVLRVWASLWTTRQENLRSDARLEAPAFAAIFLPGDPLLYACSKAHHLPELIREFEALEARVAEYGQHCLCLADELQEMLKARAPIPASILDRPTTPAWLYPAHLALYLLNHRLGVDRSPLSLDEKTLSTAGRTTMARGEVDDLRACVSLVEELLPDDGRAAALLEEARTLASQVVETERKIERKLREARLAGRCPYVRISWRPTWWPSGME